MKKLQLLFLCSGILLLAACSNIETVKVTAEDGTIEEFQQDKKTKLKNGFYKLLSADGKLMAEATYVNGEVMGERKLYFKDGKVMQIQTLKGKIFEGPFKEFHPNGKVAVEGQYVNSKFEGTWKYYYENGQVKEIVNFKDNNEDGPFTEYHRNGKLRAEGQYKLGVNKFGESNEDSDNKEHGELKMYDENGELEKTMKCEFGVCETTWSKNPATEK